MEKPENCLLIPLLESVVLTSALNGKECDIHVPGVSIVFRVRYTTDEVVRRWNEAAIRKDRWVRL